MYFKKQLIVSIISIKFIFKNSLESAINDLNNLQNLINCKDEELISKNQKIDHLESIIK
jgi:hypothetical protein